MNIKNALKQKNKLVQELNQLVQRMVINNTVIEGNQRPYSSKETLGQVYKKIEEINVLKTQIHRANAPVYDKIFALAELKGMIKELKKIPTDEGKQTERYGSVQSIKEVELNVTDIDNSISILETQIEELQNELDVHNATTNI